MFLQGETNNSKAPFKMPSRIWWKMPRKILSKMPNYSGFLVRYYWCVVILTVLIGTACTIACLVIGNYPDLEQPVKVQKFVWYEYWLRDVSGSY